METLLLWIVLPWVALMLCAGAAMLIGGILCVLGMVQSDRPPR